MTSSNPYDTFSYDKPADYIPAMQQRYNEINEGFERAEVMAKVNDQQRLANAKIMGNAINTAYKFSKTMGEYMEKEQEKRENIFKNRSAELRLATGANLADMAAYNRNKDNLQGDHAYHQSLAADLLEKGDANSVALAEELSNLSGWRLRIFKEGLVKQAGVNYNANFYGENGINSLDETGQARFKLDLKNDDGTSRQVTWATATLPEKLQLIHQYNEHVGLSDVSFASTEFLQDVHYNKHEQNINSIIQTETQNHIKQFNAERIKGYDDQLIVSAKHGSLGEVVHQLWQNEAGWFKGDKGAARTAIKERLFHLVRTGEIDAGELVQLTEFKFLHKGTNQEEDLTYFKEFAAWGSEISALQEEIHQNELKERKAKVRAYVDDVLAYQDDENAPLPTNQDKQQLIQGLREHMGPGFRDSEIPEDLKNLLTIEDKTDQEYIDILELKRDLNQKIHPNDWRYITDYKEREKWRKHALTAAGSGMDPTVKGLRDRDVSSIVATFLEDTNLQTEKSLEYNILRDKALVKYNTLYALHAPFAEPGREADLHQTILAEVLADLPNMDTTLAPTSDPRTFSRDVSTGKKQLTDGYSANKTSYTETLSSGILKGSEKHYKKLEKYAEDPINNSIPAYYYSISEDITDLSAWDVANLQYKSQTGKELPPPYTVTKTKKKHPAIQRMFYFRSNGKKNVRAQGKEDNIDFNKEYMTEGVE